MIFITRGTWKCFITANTFSERMWFAPDWELKPPKVHLKPPPLQCEVSASWFRAQNPPKTLYAMYGSVVSVAPKCRRLERLTSVADQLARSPDQPKLPNLVGSNPPKSYQKHKLSPPRPKNTPYTSSRLPASLLHQNWNCLQFTARPNCRAVILPFFVMRREIFSSMAAKSQRASEVQWHFLEATDHCRKNPEGEDFGRKKKIPGRKIPCR